MKFYAQSTQAMYLSERGPLPPPLKAFDVFYVGYPQIGFSVIGSPAASENYPQVSISFVPPTNEEIAPKYRRGGEGRYADPNDWFTSPGRLGETGELDTEQPMRIPRQAPVLPRGPTEADEIEAEIISRDGRENKVLKPGEEEDP